MAKATLGDLYPYLRYVYGTAGAKDLTDRKLLQLFVKDRDELAFAALVRRHGPLVMGTCRRILGDSHLAEDAFQATFMVLARRANSVSWRKLIASWLHAVARRVALKAKTQATARRAREMEAAHMPHNEPLDDMSLQELRGVLDEEIGRLAEKYQTPMILCHLQGKTQEQAAKELGWSKSTLAKRLERAREILCKRLTKRGITLSAAAMASAVSEASGAASVGALLAVQTAKAAVGVASGSALAAVGLSAGVISLAKDGMKATFAISGKLVLAAMVLGLTVGGASLAAYVGFVSDDAVEMGSAHAAKSDRAIALQKTEPQEKGPQERVDLYGDPLPEGAMARLGTVRWRVGHQPHQIIYTADGKALAVAGREDLAASFFDSVTGKQIHRLARSSWAGFGAISPDATLLLSEPGLTLIDIASGKEIRRLDNAGEAEGPVRARMVAFSPDGRYIGSALPSGQGAIGLWDVATGKKIRDFSGHTSYPNAITFSPDSKTLVSASPGDGTLRFWEAATGKEVRRLTADKRVLFTHILAFSRDGKLLATRMRDGVIWLLHVETAKGFEPLKVDEESEGPVAFYSDNQLAVSSISTGMIHLLDARSGKEIRKWQGPLSLYCLAASPDGKVLAVSPGWFGPTIFRWSTDTGKELELPAGHTYASIDIRFSFDNKTLFSCSADKILQWNVSTGEIQRTIFSRAYAPTGNLLVCNSFSNEGKLITGTVFEGVQEHIGVSKPSVFHVWEAATGNVIRSFKTPFPASFTRISPDGKLFLSEHQDGTRLWEIETGKMVQHFKKGAGMRFALDSQSLVYYAGTGKSFAIHVWDTLAQRERAMWDTGLQSIGPFLALSKDGALLATRARIGNLSFVSIWSTATGKELTQVRLESEVYSMSFSPTNRVMAIGTEINPYAQGVKTSISNSIEFWEVPSGERIRRIESSQGTIDRIAFSGDSRLVATAGEDATILLWDLTNESLKHGSKESPATYSDSQLRSLCSELAGDAASAEFAIWKLILAAERSLPILREHLQVNPAPPEQIAKLMVNLNVEDFALRSKAFKELNDLGESAEAAVRKHLENKLPLEVRQRLQEFLKNRDKDAIRKLRAIEVLEQIGTAESRHVLQTLANQSPNPRVAEAATAALARLAKRT